MSHLPIRLPSRRQRGVALLEVMIAVVILGLGMLGTIGLQARSYAALSEASQRAEATIAADRLVGIMSNDVDALAAYNVASGATPGPALAPWLAETQAAIPGALVSVAVVPEDSRDRVDILIRWTRTAGGRENRHQLTAYISP